MPRTTRSKDTTPVPEAQPITQVRRGRGRPPVTNTTQDAMPAATGRGKGAAGRTAKARQQARLAAVPEIDPAIVKQQQIENNAEQILDSYFEHLDQQADLLFKVIKIDNESNVSIKSSGKLSTAHVSLMSAANEFKDEASLFIDPHITLSHLISSQETPLPTNQCLFEVFTKANLALLVAGIFKLEDKANEDSLRFWRTVDDGFMKYFAAPQLLHLDSDWTNLFSVAIEARAQLVKEQILYHAHQKRETGLATVQNALINVFFKSNNTPLPPIDELLRTDRYDLLREWSAPGLELAGYMPLQHLYNRVCAICEFFLGGVENGKGYLHDLETALTQSKFLTTIGSFLPNYKQTIDEVIASQGGHDTIVQCIIDLKSQHVQTKTQETLVPAIDERITGLTEEGVARLAGYMRQDNLDLASAQQAPEANMSSAGGVAADTQLPTQDNGFDAQSSGATTNKRGRDALGDNSEQGGRVAKAARIAPEDEDYAPSETQGPIDNNGLDADEMDPSQEDMSYEDIHQRGRQASQAYHSKRQVTKPPQRRTAWHADESSELIKLIGKWGAAYSLIKSKDIAGLNSLHLRDQNSLRDKARNIKFDYLKAKAALPRNFENVQLKKTQIELLRDMGISYHQDRLRAK